MSESSVLVELPGARLYTDDCYVTPFTLADVRSMAVIAQTSDAFRLYEVMNKKVSLDVEKLTQKDFWYIMHWERVNSYNYFPMKLEWTCPFCSHKNVGIYSEEKMIINELDESYGPQGIDIDLPSKGRVPFRLPHIGDEREALRYAREGLHTNDPAELQLIRLACLFEPNGESLDSRYRFVKSLTSDDSIVVDVVERTLDYGVQDEADFECDKCKEVSRVSFTFSMTSFLPTDLDSGDIRSRILPSSASRPATSEPRQSGFREAHFYKEELQRGSEGTDSTTKRSSGEIPISRSEVTEEMINDLPESDGGKVESKPVPRTLSEVVGDSSDG